MRSRNRRKTNKRSNSGQQSQDRLLTTREVAELLNVHPNTVRRWSSKGILTPHRFGTRGDRRFAPEDIRRFLEETKKNQILH